MMTSVMQQQTHTALLPHPHQPERQTTSFRTFLRYAEQLEEFIHKHKAKPPDIKHWPYGPYWPPFYYGLVIQTPKLLSVSPRHSEPLWRRDWGKYL